jgi:hypothetical protein
MSLNARNGHDLKYFVERLSKPMFFLWKSHCLEIFPSADCTDFIFNKWHPLSWLVFVIAVVVTIIIDGLSGVPRAWSDCKFGFAYSSFWKENMDIVEFIPRNPRKWN